MLCGTQLVGGSINFWSGELTDLGNPNNKLNNVVAKSKRTLHSLYVTKMPLNTSRVYFYFWHTWKQLLILVALCLLAGAFWNDALLYIFRLLLVTCLSVSVCSKLFSEFILKVPPGRLVKQKLYCMIDIVHSDLFTQHGRRTRGVRQHWLCKVHVVGAYRVYTHAFMFTN